jgi:hypothetical protein
MDKLITNKMEWNIEYEEQIKKDGNWAYYDWFIEKILRTFYSKLNSATVRMSLYML